MGHYPPSMLSGGSVTSQAITGALGYTPCPTPHGHSTFADIAGLQAALDGKQAAGSYALTSHNHSGVYQPVGSYLVAADLTWTAITGKPSTFAPAAHTHTIAEVTGLQAALDGKQAAGSYAAATHTHVWADITTGKPTTLAGYGITDAASSTHNHAGVYQPAGTYLTVFGYLTGSGGTVVQATSKATAVILNKACGEITLNAASLAAATIVTFVLNNSVLAATDQIVCTHHAGGTFGAYTINARVTGAGAASVAVRNNTAAALAEAIVIKFSVIKGVTA